MIAFGLAIEAVAAGLVIAALLLGEERAAAWLWSSVAVVLLGLAVTMAGVRRARPLRRPAIPPPAADH